MSELRRLRAALGASAAARRGSPAGWLDQEIAFLSALAAALERPDVLGEIWRELRMHATALAADLPENDDSLALLRARLEAD